MSHLSTTFGGGFEKVAADDVLDNGMDLEHAVDYFHGHIEYDDALVNPDEDDEDEDDSDDMVKDDFGGGDGESVGNSGDEDDEDEESCELCGGKYEDGGDGWDGLCPDCADRVSNYMDEHKVDRDAAIAALRQQSST